MKKLPKDDFETMLEGLRKTQLAIKLGMMTCKRKIYKGEEINENKEKFEDYSFMETCVRLALELLEDNEPYVESGE